MDATMRLDPANYWARYLRRWKWTALAVSLIFLGISVLGGMSTMFDSGSLGIAAGLMTVLMSFFCGGLFVGSAVNLVVALVRPRATLAE